MGNRNISACVSIEKVTEIPDEEGYRPYLVMVVLGDCKFLQTSAILGSSIWGYTGSYHPESWYYLLYSSFCKVFNMEEEAMYESDYYTMHFECDTLEEAESKKKYIEEYLSMINDNLIIAKFSKVPDKDKIRGLTEEFWKSFFKQLHDTKDRKE